MRSYHATIPHYSLIMFINNRKKWSLKPTAQCDLAQVLKWSVKHLESWTRFLLTGYIQFRYNQNARTAKYAGFQTETSSTSQFNSPVIQAVQVTTAIKMPRHSRTNFNTEVYRQQNYWSYYGSDSEQMVCWWPSVFLGRSCCKEKLEPLNASSFVPAGFFSPLGMSKMAC